MLGRISNINLSPCENNRLYGSFPLINITNDHYDGQEYLAIRYAYSNQVFKQNKIDYIWDDDDLLKIEKLKNRKIKYIIYLCSFRFNYESGDIIVEKVNDLYLISKKWSEVVHIYLQDNDIYWSDFHYYKNLIKNNISNDNFSSISTFNRDDIDIIHCVKCGCLIGGMLNNEVNCCDKYLTIITVVYNNALLLEQAIQSVINIPQINIEYIVVDGGSSDQTIDVIKKYEKYISLWISCKDNGIYDAMNKAIKLSRGSDLLFLNSDDIILCPNTLVGVSDILKRYDAVCFKTVNLGSFLNWMRPKKTVSDITKYSHQSVVTKKKYLYDINKKYIADIKYLKGYENSFISINKILSGFRIGGASSAINNIKINEIFNNKDFKLSIKIYRVIALLIKFLLNRIGMLRLVERYQQYNV